MRCRAVQVILLILTLVLTIFLLIAAAKYGSWAHVMTATTGSWLPLVFYIGTIPLLSMVYTTAHLAALQFDGLPEPPYADEDQKGSPNPSLSHPKTAQTYDAGHAASTTRFVLFVSAAHAVAWLVQASLCTACELGPVLAGAEGHVPGWCPQSRFVDTGQPAVAHMLATLATVKDLTMWLVVLPLALGLVECARRESMRAGRAQRDMWRREGAGVDFGGPAEGSQGWKAPESTAVTTVELAAISGPKLLYRAEERQKAETPNANRPPPPAPPSTNPGAPANSYGGNAVSNLKRSGTLNHMYESRV